MTRFLSCTALALVLTVPAFADNHMNKASYIETKAEDEIRASDLIGMSIYSTEAELAEDTVIAEGGETEWDDIGEVNDVILGRDGSTKAVVLGVGGFLGIGEKDVAIEMSSLKFVNEQDDAGDFFLVVNSSKAELEEAPAFETQEMEGAESTTMAATDQTGAVTAPIDRPMLTPPNVEREGYAETTVADLTAENLQGTAVYGPEDESVGEIGELILDDGGQINEAVIDVGGFLGIGERPVAVTFDELRILRSDGGDDVRVYIDSAQEQLEQLPEYEG